ncbi:MAG: EMC3/TMCO1 family protein [Candidatus Diapherotrites archaeon]|nr:EMC3/TMCO1 family protein [Candidatus Diapherotrites archaeon]
MALISPAIDISLITLALVVIGRFLQSKLINKEKQKASQQRMKEKQKRIKELVASNDERSKSEAAALQREMFAEMGESMQGSMRYMMVSLPFFLVVYAALGFYYGGLYFDALFPVPKFDGLLPVGLATKTGWFKWYFFNYMIASIVLGIVLKVWVKAREQPK